MKLVLRNINDMPKIKKAMKEGDPEIELVLDAPFVLSGKAESIMNFTDTTSREHNYILKEQGISDVDDTVIGYVFVKKEE